MLRVPPLRPAVYAAQLEDVGGATGDDRPVLERKALPRDALRRAQELVLNQLGVHGLGRSADGESRETLDDRRRAVGRLVRVWLEHPRPQPAAPLLLDDGDGVALRHMQDHVAVAVEASRANPRPL